MCVFWGYNKFMLNSTEHQILDIFKTEMLNTFLAFELSNVVFIILIHVKMPTIVVILKL